MGKREMDFDTIAGLELRGGDVACAQSGPAAALLPLPAALQSTCADTVDRTDGGGFEMVPMLPAAAGSILYEAVSVSPGCGIAPGANAMLEPVSV
jgi:hypothetical protein